MKNSSHLWLVSSSLREPSHVQDPESRSVKKQQAQHLSRDLDGLATVSQLNMEHFKGQQESLKDSTASGGLVHNLFEIQGPS